eukprot:6542050-Alexandrium_andersonii.AAC.1
MERIVRHAGDAETAASSIWALAPGPVLATGWFGIRHHRVHAVLVIFVCLWVKGVGVRVSGSGCRRKGARCRV